MLYVNYILIKYIYIYIYTYTEYLLKEICISFVISIFFLFNLSIFHFEKFQSYRKIERHWNFLRAFAFQKGTNVAGYVFILPRPVPK